MKADAYSLAATLNSAEVDFYTIPQYQRPYKWLRDNYEILWEDLNEAYREYLLDTKAEKTPESYFLGPVCLL